jgi:hypothetical protein
MLDLLTAALPILLVDVLNPALFAMLVFAAGSDQPAVNSAAMLAGHTLAYFLAGIAVSFGVEQLATRLANPEPVDFVISGLVGVGLLSIVLPVKRTGAPARDEPEWQLTPLRCFGFGAIINFVGIPFALPYFAFVDQLLKASLSTPASLTALGFYNVAYALPFTVVPVAVAFAGARARPLLDSINRMLTRAADLMMPWLFGLLGIALLADSVAFFLSGEGLWAIQ